jgi:hypothetical protein
MDVWAWGAIMREALGVALPDGWHWLELLIRQAMSVDPADRPDAGGIIEGYGRYIGFGDHERPHLGATLDSAVAWYPLAVTPWPAREHLPLSLGWDAWLPECRRLSELHTAEALLRIEELCTWVLGDPGDPDSLWQALRDDPEADAFALGTGDPIPRATALTFLGLLVAALVELVELTGADTDLDRLERVARAWEWLGEFESEVATALLAQAWLSLDDPGRALPYVRRSYAADPDHPSALAAMRLYYLVTGDRALAAKVAFELGDRAGDDRVALRGALMAIVDLLEAGEYDELGGLLTALANTRVDLVSLVGYVLAGRRGPVRSDPAWRGLRDHSTVVSSSMSIEKLRYLLEAAYQRGDVEFAARRADVARARPLVRLPIQHEARAAIEAVALGRDPATRSLTARLNNRAKLWTGDGRPDDPLVGLCLVAAHRWAGGAGAAQVSGEVHELLARSLAITGDGLERLLLSTRHCSTCLKPVEVRYLSVCGCCHRLYCADCVEGGQLGACWCGGDLAYP